jgi:hypothetical protein
MIICSVPTTPNGCLLLTPGLLRFIGDDDLTAPFMVFDIGVEIASINGLNGKLKFTYKTYMKYIDMIQKNETLPYNVKIMIPDDWELTTHIKLARAWLKSQERKTIIDKLATLGVVKIQEILVIRRIIHPLNLVDITPFKEFIGQGFIYGIPQHISNAMADGSNIRCSTHPNVCIQHAKLIVNTISELDENAEFHLMGPPIATVLTKLMDEQKITSADTTSHRVDIKHVKYVNKHANTKSIETLLFLAKYLNTTRRRHAGFI